MIEASNWRDVKEWGRAADLTSGQAERVARRREMREQMLAWASGAQLTDISPAARRDASRR